MGLNAMQVVLQEITGWLDGEITDTPTFLASQEGDNRVVLTPREQGLQQIIERIELQLQGKSGLVESVHIQETKGSSTSMRFSDSVLNGQIPQERFSRP